MLTGKYARGQAPPAGTRLQRWGDRAGGLLSDESFDAVEALEGWAAARGHRLVDLAVAWLAAKPVVASVIAGATRAEQVRANVAGAGWLLTPDEVVQIDALAPLTP
jgi:aryl-alcohol dehydrogenase-like predicted oxidoreductase